MATMTNPYINPHDRENDMSELEINLKDLAYSHTSHDLEMAYEIGKTIYQHLKKIEPEIDNWYERLT